MLTFDIRAMNLQSIDLNLLVAFEALMDERSVTRAARRMGLSQPAMSNALARLRRTFDDVLLVKTREGMLPTPAAQSLIVTVRAALAQLRTALEEKPTFDPATSRRTFHVVANDYAEMALLAPVVRQIRTEAHEIVLRIYRNLTVFDPPPEAQLSDRYDLATGFFPDALALDVNVHSEVLWEEENVCIAGANARIGDRLTLKQFASAHHVAVFYKQDGPGVIDSLLAEKGLARKRAVLAPHFLSVPYLVAGSDMIATVPEGLARMFEKQLRLRIFPAPVDIPPFRLSMLWHDRLNADPAHVWIRRLIASVAKRLRSPVH